MVDNGSHDGSVAALAREFPSVRVLDVGDEPRVRGRCEPRRRRHARAGRRGAECRRRRWCRAPPPRCWRGSPPSPTSPRSGPVIRNPDGSQYPSARTVPSPGDAVGSRAARHGAPRRTASPAGTASSTSIPTRPRDVEWISGAAMWLRRSALESVGGWDERYFMYVEDVDLCWRLRRLGWRVAYEPGGHRRARAGGQHRPASVPDDRAPPPVRLPVRHEELARRAAPPAAPHGGAARGARRHRDRRPCARCATRTPAASPDSLALAMPQSRRRSGRSAMRARYRKPKRRRGGSMGWNVAIAVVVIVGVVLIIFTRSNDTSSAGTGPPHAANPTTGEPGDHWHTYLGREHLRAVARPRARVRDARRRPDRHAERGHPLPRRRPDPHPPVRERRKKATTRRSASTRATATGACRPTRSTRGPAPRAIPARRAGATATPARSGSTRARRASWSGRSTARRGPATRATTTSRTARRSRSASCPRARRSSSRPTRARPSPTSPTRTRPRS